MTNIPYPFQGLSGQWYNFAMSDLPTTAANCCGVYIFSKKLPDGRYEVLYIGKASVLSKRANDHHGKVRPALALGMTTLGQIGCANDDVASAVERDLIQRFNPPLNRQMRTN